MADLMTSYDVSTIQNLCHLVEKAKGFLLHLNLFYCDLIERKPWGSIKPPPSPQLNQVRVFSV